MSDDHPHRTPSSDDSDLEEIPASSFTFRESKHDPCRAEAQRPAFISARMSQEERQPPIPHLNFFCPKSPPSDDFDLEEIPASSFKSKHGPVGQKQRPEDDTTVVAVLARRRSSQTSNSDKASYEYRDLQPRSDQRAPRGAIAPALTFPAFKGHGHFVRVSRTLR